MKRLLSIFAVILVAAVLTTFYTTKNYYSSKGAINSASEMSMGGHDAPAGPSGGATGGDGHSHGSVHDGQTNEAVIKADDVKAVWTVGHDHAAQAKEDTAIRIAFEKDGKPVEEFDTSHEEKLHLIVVSKDLSFFNHIHPTYKGKGVFEIATQFPAGGDYKLIADVVPTGGSAMSKMSWTHIEGESAEQQAILPESDFTKTSDGKEVTLSIDKLAANQELNLNFTIKDEKTKAPITDLQPYLGAVGHVVVLTEDTEQYLHVHPIEEKATGPDAQFATTFPKSGVYKIWGQFKHKDKVFTVPFVVKVP